jgi:thiol-disulfide isomerase/thioredoxin
VAIVLLLGVANARMTSTKLQKQSVGAHEIGVGNLTSNVRHWRRDMAVMFYAPWCKYCKQLKPSWDQIAIIQKDAGRKNGDNANSNGGDGRGMEVGVFDCDTESANTEICQALGVDRYPSIYFIGYGDFNQAHPGKVLAKSDHPRVVRYNADLYPDRIYDWVQMLAGISAMQRGLDNLRGAFGGGSSHGPRRRIADLESDLENSDYRMRLYADELERYVFCSTRSSFLFLLFVFVSLFLSITACFL